MSKFTSTWAVVVSVIILLGLKVYNPLPLQTLQLKTFDLYQKFGDNYQSKSLVLLDISDEALNKQGQWPWKRDVIAQVISNLRQSGAGVIMRVPHVLLAISFASHSQMLRVYAAQDGKA